MRGVLNGVVMEIQDCAMPLVRDVVATDDPNVAFKDIDAAFLVGAMPRKEGMERKDLLAANVKIFKVQGQALNQVAKKTVKVLDLLYTSTLIGSVSGLYPDPVSVLKLELKFFFP